jgi:hypothetical protein
MAHYVTIGATQILFKNGTLYNNGCNTDFVEKWHSNNYFQEVQFCNLRYIPENLCTKFFPFGKALCVVPVST